MRRIKEINIINSMLKWGEDKQCESIGVKLFFELDTKTSDVNCDSISIVVNERSFELWER